MKQTLEHAQPAGPRLRAASLERAGTHLAALVGLAALLASPPLLAQRDVRTVVAVPVAAEGDRPGLPPDPLPVGRVAAVQGQVYLWDPDDRGWAQAEPGRPLAAGDRVSTGPVGRAELQLGSSTLRLHGRTELDVAAHGAEGLSLVLRRGSLALRVRTQAAAARIEVVTPQVRLLPAGPGHFRIDRGDARSGEQSDRTQASVWEGLLEVAGEQGFRISRGEQVELWRAEGALQHAWGNPAEDEFAERVLREDAKEARLDRLATTAPPLPLEITGAADLARHGRWDRHPEAGWVWLPQVSYGAWAPYQQGRWVWVHPWGWTWVDQSPWAFATYHGGRWLRWGQRWAWAPYPVVHGQHKPPRPHEPGYAPLPLHERWLPPGAQQPPAYAPSPRHRPPAAGRPPRQDPPPGDDSQVPTLEERKDWRMRMPLPRPRPEQRGDGLQEPRSGQRPEQEPGQRPGARSSERPAERQADRPPDRPQAPARATAPAPLPPAPAAEPPRRPAGGGEPQHEHQR